MCPSSFSYNVAQERFPDLGEKRFLAKGMEDAFQAGRDS